jgi:LmbE family N-acetylglucosaminyl deacetylase
VEERSHRRASGGVIPFGFPKKRDGEPLRVLCLGAHSDDIEIGCGGTILRLREEFRAIEFYWVVFTAAGIRTDEAKAGAAAFANVQSPDLKNFRDGFLPFDGARVKDAFEELKSKVSPELVFTHTRNDAHQDHRLLCELTWNTFRDHLILEYEIPKYDGDMGQPNCFVPLTVEQVQKKAALLMETFGSQRNKRWFQPETFLALMRLRGMESNAPSGYAEAFHGRKVVL